MPRRSEREQYASRFDGNPLAGLDGDQAYDLVRWGNAPNAHHVLDGPEPELVGLGRLARLELENSSHEWDEEDAPVLAIGLESNRLYVLPIDDEGNPVDLGEDGPYDYVDQVQETHYTADKGGNDAYWYHEHEEPLPALYVNPDTGAMIIEPADNDGAPSYVVGPEGIIG